MMNILARAHKPAVHHRGQELLCGFVHRGPCQRHVSSPSGFRRPTRRSQFRPFAALPFFGGTAKDAEAHGAEQTKDLHDHHPKFDLPLAVVLAAASFEAYLQPQGGQGFQQSSVFGPTVTFTDKAFLTKAYSGVLLVDLVGAANLRAADNNGLSDPYAVISLGNSSYRTKTVPKNLNPKWNAQFSMYYKDASSDILRIRLYDEDLGKSDDELGLAMLSLGALPSGKGGESTFTLPLRGSGAGNGATVTLRCRLLSFANSDPDDVAAMTSTTTTADSPSAIAGLQAAAAAVRAVVPQLGGAAPAPAQPQGAAPAPASSKSDDDGASTVTLPGGEEVPNLWRVLATMVGRCLGAAALSPVAFIEDKETDSQLWVYRNIEEKEAVLAFRGTEEVKWKDIATDLNLTPCSLNPERLDDNAGLPFTARIIKAVSGVNQNQMMVHKGFLGAYDSVKRTAFSLLDEITGSDQKGEPWRVLVTGHSLGGALATLAAYELAERRTPARAVQKISLYTYGAPRVGNKAFAEEFDRLVPDAWRVTNRNDIIPSVPRLMGYCHVGHAVRLSSDGVLSIGRSTADSTDVFGEGKAGVEVIQEIVSKVSEQARPWDEVYSEIADRELKLLDQLVGGQGLEEHMENFYLASLQQAVEVASKRVADGKGKGKK